MLLGYKPHGFEDIKLFKHTEIVHSWKLRFPFGQPILDGAAESLFLLAFAYSLPIEGRTQGHTAQSVSLQRLAHEMSGGQGAGQGALKRPIFYYPVGSLGSRRLSSAP